MRRLLLSGACDETSLQRAEPMTVGAVGVQQARFFLNARPTQGAFVQYRPKETSVITLLSIKAVTAATRLSRASFYSRVDQGLMPRPVKQGERLSKRQLETEAAVRSRTLSSITGLSLWPKLASSRAERNGMLEPARSWTSR
ncbi:MAG: hypothetical protein WDN44_07525 [Sphingomonas sp.]